MLDELTNIFSAQLSGWQALLGIGFSLVASILVYLLYHFSYGSRHIGAGVDRTFLIGGPAITLLFLVIQTSIPLGVGLLGALSFVRFRTPIKDPAEIGFLLLLIASSIAAATGNLIALGVLLAIAFVTAVVLRLVSNRGALPGRGHLMISVDRPSYAVLEKKLTSFLKEQVRGLSLETMSTLDDRISLRYQYRRQPGFDWGAFTNELNKLAGIAKVEIFVG